MSGVAKIYDVELDPTKESIVAHFGAIQDLLGSYRFVDPDGKVGIEIHIGHDMERRLMQFATVYTETDEAPEALFTATEHPVLGTRYVAPLTSNAVAVREVIRVILEADNGAEYSNGSGPAVDVRGSGTEEELSSVGAVKISEYTRQRAVGTVLIDDKPRSFLLRIPNLLVPGREIARGHTTSRMRLTGWPPENPEDKRVLAELSWMDR